MIADHGSYFHNYLQKKQTYMRRKKWEDKWKEEKRKRKKKKKVELLKTEKRKGEEDWVHLEITNYKTCLY